MTMLDNDNLTYSYQKRAVGNNPAERSLITLERSQKLDLLIHLLANLRQALIVCGPEGIGKTTLLQTLLANRKDQWRICVLQGSSNLSFEMIVNDLSRFLNLGHSGFGFDLASLRASCEKQKVVLIIDDAGELVPGLIGELVELSDSLPGLRLVFSMTYDEFHIKRASDKAVDDCHFIELPPLNQKQCAEFLQNLSAQPGAPVSFNAVTDSLVADLYRETHGIPGKILTEIPKFNQYQSRKKSRGGLWLGVLLISLIAAWAMKSLLPSMPAIGAVGNNLSETVKTIAVPPVTAPKVAGVEPKSPALVTPERDKAAAQGTALPPQPEAVKTGIAITPEETNINATLDDAVRQTKAVAPHPAASEPSPSPQPQKPQEPPVASTAKTEAPAAAIPVPAQTSPPPQAVAQIPKKTPDAKSEKPATEEGNRDWIMAQPAGNFTLQVMVLSNKAAINRILKKYAEYSDSLKYYTIGKTGQEKYVLIYGSFPTAAEAKQYKALMPGEFRQALEKRFKALQTETRR